MKIKYLEQPAVVPLAFLPDYPGSRTFVVTEDIEVELSGNYFITITKGFKTDLASIPGWAWSLMKPIDKAFIGDLIHDWLWVNKLQVIERFENSIYNARKYSDNERKCWRLAMAPELKVKTYITHFFIRVIGSFFYSRELNIPN